MTRRVKIFIFTCVRRLAIIEKIHLFIMRKYTFYLISFCLFYGCQQDSSVTKVQNLTPPKAAKIIYEFSEHGTKRLDEYFWMNNPKDTNVLNILTAENAYTTARLKHTEGVQKKLYDEMVARVEQKAQSVPILKNGYWYYNRYEEGKEYPLICRKKSNWAAAEEVILNVADMAKGYKIYRLFEYEVNPENNKIAYLVDTSGNRRNTLYIKDLMTDKLLADEISDVANGGLVWSNNGKNLLYLLNDNTVRSYKAMRHIVGADVKTDKLIFTETDNTYELGLFKTNSKKYIILESGSTLTAESRFLDADNVDAPARVFSPRLKDLKYSINHYASDTFYVYNNDKAKNFKLSSTPLSKTGVKDWKDVIPHSDSSYLMNYEVLKNYIVIQDKVKGLNKIRIIDRTTKAMENVDFGEEAYVANMYLADNDNFDMDSIRFNYASLTTPNSTFRYDFKSKTKTILKQDKVAGFNTSEYETKRIWVKSRDSVDVPVSIIALCLWVLWQFNGPLFQSSRS
jgi:oligopeptidase B